MPWDTGLTTTFWPKWKFYISSSLHIISIPFSYLLKVWIDIINYFIYCAFKTFINYSFQPVNIWPATTEMISREVCYLFWKGQKNSFK